MHQVIQETNKMVNTIQLTPYSLLVACCYYYESKLQSSKWLCQASGPAMKERLTTADDYSLLHELYPNPAGQLKLKPGTVLGLPRIPCDKPSPPLRRVRCLVHAPEPPLNKNLNFSSDTSANIEFICALRWNL